MANIQKAKAKSHQKRKLRSKSKLFGTAERPRMTVYKSLKHIYAQLVDDESQKCICGTSSMAKALTADKVKKSEMAGKVGELIGKIAADRGISTIIFDRSGYLYHGRVKALAEGARKSGLKF
jgi:large subunit ribosomal protein L18